MRHLHYIAALTLAASFSTDAFAAADLSSAAYAASVRIEAASVLKANTTLASASGSGTAPASYDDQGTLLAINQTTQLVTATFLSPISASETLTSDDVSSRAFTPTPTSATGTTSIANLDFSLASLTGILPLASLGITADAIGSTTTAGYDAGGLFSSGNATITNLVFSSSALGIAGLDGLAYSNPTANTLVINALGLRIVLNEQGQTSSATGIAMFTNAIHVSLNDFIFGGKALTGDVIVGRSQASVTGFAVVPPPAAAVPEPATWAMLMLGCGLIGAALRTGRRRRIILRALA